MQRLLIAMVALACSATLVSSAAAEKFPDRGFNPNPELFQKDARIYGSDMTTWAERASQWVYGQPLDHSPLFDPTGANCAVGQRGPVWYIARIAGPPVFTGERSCTIPHSKSLLLYIGAIVNAYPCPPEFGFEPATGQSLYDFLSTGAREGMDLVDQLEVSLDGRMLNDVMSYRFASDDLFEITGDPSLRAVFDPCITGSPQPAVVDGFFMMFKPLARGEHTVRVHGTATPIGHDKTFIYHLTSE
jgi:hypothetical protein